MIAHPPTPTPPPAAPRRILCVRSGGGMPGLDIHVGLARAMWEIGVRPTHYIGTSAGACVAAMEAAGYDGDACAAILTGLSDRHVRNARLLWRARFAWIDWWLSNVPILDLLRDMLPSSQAALKRDLRAMCVRYEDGSLHDALRVFPDVAEAVMASMSISAVFPPLRAPDGHHYVDGGVVANVPLPDDWRDYDQIWLCLATGEADLFRRRGGLVTAAYRNMQWAMQYQILRALDRVRGAPNVIVLCPPDKPTGSMFRFCHDLIERSRAYALRHVELLATRGGSF